MLSCCLSEAPRVHIMGYNYGDRLNGGDRSMEEHQVLPVLMLRITVCLNVASSDALVACDPVLGLPDSIPLLGDMWKVDRPQEQPIVSNEACPSVLL